MERTWYVHKKVTENIEKKKKIGKTSLIVIKGFILCFVEYMLPFSVLGSSSVG